LVVVGVVAVAMEEAVALEDIELEQVYL